MKLPTKIPTILGFLIIALIIGGLSIFSNLASDSKTNAFKTKEPKQLRVTNITESSFTVTWITDDPATGLVSLLNSNTSQKTCPDERDLKDKLGKYITHSVICSGLKFNTEYKYRILSDSKVFSDKNGPFIQKTSLRISASSNGLEPAFGTILDDENNPSSGALVYLTLTGSQLLSTIVKESGSWLIPLNFIKSENLAQNLPSKDRIEEYIQVRTNAIDETSATTDTLNDSPVPNMIIGKTYDFRKQQANNSPNRSLSDLTIPSTTTPSSAKNVLGNTTSSPQNIIYNLSITQPSDKSVVVSNLPLFTGTAVPNKKVTLTIGLSDPTSISITAGNDGLWRYTPPKPLGEGKQIITATSLDTNNKPTAITHIFTVLKSGTQVLGDATPSATLTPTFVPTPSSTLAAQPPPTSGTMLPTIIFSLLSLSLLLGGAVVLIK